MTLADGADIITIAAGFLAALGVMWLGYVRFRRHQKFQRDCVLIREALSIANDSHTKGMRARQKYSDHLEGASEVSTEEFIKMSTIVMGRQLDSISFFLRNLQLMAYVDLLRRNEDDEGVSFLLKNWEVRSPITRKE